MRGWWREISGLVLPVDCAGCGRPRAELCERCLGLLGGAATARRVCPSPEPPGLPPVYAAARYGDEVRAVVLAHKERGALGLARPLGAALAGAVVRAIGPSAVTLGTAAPQVTDCRWSLPEQAPTALGTRHGSPLGPWRHRGPDASRTALRGASGPPARRRWLHPGRDQPGPLHRAPPYPAPLHLGRDHPGPLLLVPVPSARRAVAQRGHDATARIARAAARELRRLGVPVRTAGVLRQRRLVADQAELSAGGRLVNLSGAVAAAPGAAPLLAALPVVLVDDLMTTGASLAVAHDAVVMAGGRVVCAAVVAGPHDARAG